MAHKTSRKKEFYVYALLDTRKPGPFCYGRWTFEYEPFYVGKGKNNRADSHLVQYERNTHKSNKIAKMRRQGYEPTIAYKKTNITERQAFDLEIQLIAKIGRAGLGPLTNLTDGGEGPSGYIPSAELIKKRAKKLRGQKRSEEIREKMREAQKKINERHAQRITYNGHRLTVREWSEKLNIPIPRIENRLRLKLKPDKILSTSKLTNSPEAEKKRQIKKQAALPKFKCYGKSLTLAEWARRLKIPQQRIRARLRRGDSMKEALRTDTFSCSTRSLGCVRERSRSRARKIKHQGVTLTVSEWAAKLKMPKATLDTRIRKKLTTAEILHVGRLHGTK